MREKLKCRRPGLAACVDIEVILDAAEAGLPGCASRPAVPRADAAHLGVPLDPASVLARRAGGDPDLHVAGAADELVKHLAAQPDAVSNGAPL